MKTIEWLTIIALLAGPVFAVQAQKWLEVEREKKSRRLRLFKTLMTTRGATVSPRHVEALNAIDLEFNGRRKKDRDVRQRWREYLDQLGSLSQDPQEQLRQLEGWMQRNQTHLENLLRDMGIAVGYDFDLVQIRRGIYTPRGHTAIELETQSIRRMILEVLAGMRTIPMDVRSLPAMQAPSTPPQGTQQREIQDTTATDRDAR
ncbi:MAG: DUF6680 family protein [Chthoniobacterales bacterium]